MTEGRTIDLQQFVDIGDRQYCITLFAPTRALKLLTRLTKLLGEPMAVMSAAEGGGPEKVFELLPKATKALMERLGDEEAVVKLVKDLLECATRDRKQITFDTEFQGRLGDMMKLLSKVVEIQFQDFFKALGENLQGAEGESKPPPAASA